MASIIEVAALAGVSVKTVSRVINSEAHVRPAMRDRVIAAIAELGYQPSQAARRLAGRKSHLLALLYSAIKDDAQGAAYRTAIQSAAAFYCREADYHLIVEPIAARTEDIEALLRRMVQSIGPDGVIVIPPLADDAAFLKAAGALGIPMVRVAGGNEGPGKRILADEEEAACELVAHLISLGHVRIGCITPSQGHLLAWDRVKGYRRAIREAGLEPDPDLEACGKFDMETSRAVAARMLGQVKRPTAIFASNDDTAVGVMIAARDMGLSLPGDLSVVGFDDSPIAALLSPPLTTVRQPYDELGRLAARILVEGIDPPSNLLKNKVILRQSTAPPRVD